MDNHLTCVNLCPSPLIYHLGVHNTRLVKRAGIPTLQGSSLTAGECHRSQQKWPTRASLNASRVLSRTEEQQTHYDVLYISLTRYWVCWTVVSLMPYQAYIRDLHDSDTYKMQTRYEYIFYSGAITFYFEVYGANACEIYLKSVYHVIYKTSTKPLQL